MSIRRANASSITKSGVAVSDVPDTPTIGTATEDDSSASITFTPSTTGGSATTYTAISSPGSITASASSSPITITGLSNGTAYTFAVRANNSSGSSAYSSASNSVTPAAALGSYDSLASIIVPSGGVSSVTFSGIPNSYDHLQLRMSNTVGATIRLNGDTTGSNYRYHVLLGNGTSAVSGTDPNNAYSPADGTTGNTVEILDILDYANTSKNKTLRSLGGFDANGSGIVWLTSNLWMNTVAVSSIVITATIPQNARFSLYGVK